MPMKKSVMLSQKNVLPAQRSEQYLTLSIPGMVSSNNKPPMRTRQSYATGLSQYNGSMTSRSINLQQRDESQDYTATIDR